MLAGFDMGLAPLPPAVSPLALTDTDGSYLTDTDGSILLGDV